MAKKIIKTGETENFDVDVYKKPAKKDIKKDVEGKPVIRSKEVIDDEGKKHVVRFAVMKKKGKEGGKTQKISVMHQKESVSYEYIDKKMS